MERRWEFGVILNLTAKPVAKKRVAALAGKNETSVMFVYLVQ